MVGNGVNGTLRWSIVRSRDGWCTADRCGVRVCREAAQKPFPHSPSGNRAGQKRAQHNYAVALALCTRTDMFERVAPTQSITGSKINGVQHRHGGSLHLCVFFVFLFFLFYLACLRKVVLSRAHPGTAGFFQRGCSISTGDVESAAEKCNLVITLQNEPDSCKRIIVYVVQTMRQ